MMKSLQSALCGETSLLRNCGHGAYAEGLKRRNSNCLFSETLSTLRLVPKFGDVSMVPLIGQRQFPCAAARWSNARKQYGRAVVTKAGLSDAADVCHGSPTVTTTLQRTAPPESVIRKLRVLREVHVTRV